MLKFRFSTFDRCEANDEALAALEITALFKGSCSPHDLIIDVEVATEYYIDKYIDEDDKEKYRDEPQLAEDLMLESFHSDLLGKSSQRRSEMEEHYPFVLGENRRLILSDPDKITAAGATYLALQFFRALRAGVVEFDGANDAEISDQKSKFDRWFPKIFEIIASYTVAGDNAGTPHITSSCRSSKRLRALLDRLCARVGAGRVKQYIDWTEEQCNANDGGVDCIVHRGGPGMPGNASLYLVGATIQERNIANKIFGTDAKNRFSELFLHKPGVLVGVLVRPFDADSPTKLKCVRNDCLLYSYEQIWRNIGKRELNSYSKRYFMSLDAKVRDLLKDLDGAQLLDEYDVIGLKTS